MPEAEPLSTINRFCIFEQMILHQQAIDNYASRASALRYVDRHRPEERMTVNGARHLTFEGLEGLKRMYDYAHSVFPIHKWSHSMGPFSIECSSEAATAR